MNNRGGVARAWRTSSLNNAEYDLKVGAAKFIGRATWSIPVVGVFTVLLAVNTVHSAEYSMTPFFGLQTELNENRRLVNRDVDAVLGLILDVGAHFAAGTETGSLTVTPTLHLTRYTDDGTNVDLDSDDVIIDAAAEHRLERMLIGVDGGFSRRGVISLELDETGNIINENIDRNQVNIEPSLDYFLSETQTLQFRLGYTKVIHEDIGATGLIDYNNYSANASYIHQLTPKDQISGTVLISRFDPDTPNRTDNIGVQTDYRRQFSETLTSNVSIGVLRSINKAPDRFGNIQETTGNGLLLDAGMQKDLEKTTLTASLSRQIIPTSSGQQNTQSALSFGTNHRFNEHLTGHLRLGFTSNERQNVDRQSSANDGQQFNAGLKWRMDEFWTLGVDYSYGHRTAEGSADSASSNSILFSLRYDGAKRAVSR